MGMASRIFLTDRSIGAANQPPPGRVILANRSSMSSLPRLACLIAAISTAYAYQSAAVPAAKGAIEGQVVNGVTGAPLKRAMIRVVGMVSPLAPATNPPARPTMVNRET